MNFSLEIGPTTDLDTVPPVNDVYITMLPGGDYKETAQQAVELVKKGFNPVPHFPARSMHSEKELKDYVNNSMVNFLYFNSNNSLPRYMEVIYFGWKKILGIYISCV